MGLISKVAHRVIFMDKGQIDDAALKTDFFGKPRSDCAQKFLFKESVALSAAAPSAVIASTSEAIRGAASEV